MPRNDLTNAMRRAIIPHLPEQAFLRRDRGDALFISNAPIFGFDAGCIPRFQLEYAGKMLRIRPDSTWLRELEAHFADPMDDFSRSLLRFRGLEPSSESMALFYWGCKLLDAPAVQSEIERFDQSVRQSAAIALRNGCGGGLYALSLLDAQAKK